MSEELTPEEEAQLEAALVHFERSDVDFCRQSLVVQNKRGVLGPMEPQPAQIKLFKAIEKQRKAGKPVRILYLKARQVMVSTGSAAKIFKEVAFYEGQSALVYAHEDSASQKLFKYYERFQEHYEPFDGIIGKPPLESKRQGELLKWQGGSFIEFHTANNVESGRSLTCRYVQLSEFAFYRDPKTLLTGLMQTIPSDPDTMVIVETTANGIGDYFYEMCDEARKGESDWEFVFFAWWEHPEYRMPLSVEPHTFKAGMSEVERDLMRRFNLDYDQLNWRRWKIKNDCKNDPRVFQQEYPSDPDEAFLVSGTPEFDPLLVQAQKAFILDGSEGGLSRIIEPTRELLIFTPRERGELTIFKRPQPNAQYAIGADPAAGIDINDGEGSADLDSACAHVYDIDTGEMVARLSWRFTAGEFGAYLRNLGEWYNWAFVVCEVNKNGGAALDRMLHLNYPRGRIYHRRQNARDGNSSVLRLGWETNTVTRPQLVSKIDTALRERSIFLRHAVSIKQLFTFVKYPDGVPRAQKNCHDDDVIACGLGIVGIQEAPRQATKTTSKKQLAVQYAPTKRAQLQKDYYGERKRDDDGWDDRD